MPTPTMPLYAIIKGSQGTQVIPCQQQDDETVLMLAKEFRATSIEFLRSDDAFGATSAGDRLELTCETMGASS